MEDALPEAIRQMAVQGECLETDFDRPNMLVPADAGHDDIRDVLTLNRRRAVIPTKWALRARYEQQRMEKEKAAQAKLKAAEMKKALKHNQHIHEKALQQGPLKPMAERTAAEQVDPDVNCLVCCVSFYALPDHGLHEKLQQKWRQCECCGRWFCPFCVRLISGGKGHEQGCQRLHAQQASAGAEPVLNMDHSCAGARAEA